MREMKDSGIEWIGEIANTHKLVRLKYVAEILDEYRKPVTAQYRNQNADILYDYYGASGIIDKIDGYTIDDHVMLIGEDGANLKLRNLPLMYEVCGKAWINNHAHILKPMKNMDFYYLFYALEALDINNYITGSAQPKLNQENLKEILIPLPSYEVQKKVSSYLDTKCSEIDATAEDIQKEISLLEEYKKSVITEAVTKGLNPDAEMKDSGIEGIKEIPVISKVVRLKYLVDKKITDGTHKTPEYATVDDGSPFLSSKDVRNGYIDWSNVKYITKTLHNILHKEVCCKRGDILLAKNGTTGVAALVDTDDVFDIYVTLAVIRSDKKKVLPEYLLYSINSNVTKEQFSERLVGIGVPNLHLNVIANTNIIVYEISEQQKIVKYLNEKCSCIDDAILIKKKQLEMLADYKKSLIYEYVTGKKEVPHE